MKNHYNLEYPVQLKKISVRYCSPDGEVEEYEYIMAKDCGDGKFVIIHPIGEVSLVDYSDKTTYNYVISEIDPTFKSKTLIKAIKSWNRLKEWGVVLENLIEALK